MRSPGSHSCAERAWQCACGAMVCSRCSKGCPLRPEVHDRLVDFWQNRSALFAQDNARKGPE